MLALLFQWHYITWRSIRTRQDDNRFCIYFLAGRGFGGPRLCFLFLDDTIPAPTIDADAALAALRRLSLQVAMVDFASCFGIVDAAGESAMIFSTEIGRRTLEADWITPIVEHAVTKVGLGAPVHELLHCCLVMRASFDSCHTKHDVTCRGGAGHSGHQAGLTAGQVQDKYRTSTGQLQDTHTGRQGTYKHAT